MNRTPLLVLPVLALLVACQPEDDSVGLLPGEERAPQYDRVAEFLDLGGVFYGYMDLTGEIDRLAETLNDLWAGIKEAEPEMNSLPLDIEAFVASSGLSGLQAIGMSSREVEPRYFHNRSILFFPEGTAGLFKIYGDSPRPFEARELAPSGADLVFEMSYDAASLRDSILDMAEAIAGPEGREKVSSELSTVRNEFGGRTPNELIESMGNRVFVVFEFVEDGEDFFYGPGLSIPEGRFLIGVDGITDLVRSFRKEIEGEANTIWRDSDNGFEITATEVGGPMFDGQAPVIVGDDATGRVLLASSREYLDQCLASGDKLKDSKEFRKAAHLLPSEGVSFTFVSPGLFKPFRSAFETGMNSSPAPIDSSVVSEITGLFFASLEKPMASVTTVGPEGIFSASNSAASHRTTLATLTFQPLFLMAGISTAMTWRTFGMFGNPSAMTRVREASREKTVLNNLRQIASGGQQYLLEEGADSVAYTDLEGVYFSPIQPVAGEDYTDLVVEFSGTLSVTLDNGEVVEYSY